MYVAVTIVIASLLITITAINVGEILCCCHWQVKQSNGSNKPSTKYNNENNTERNLYAGEELIVSS